MIHPFGADEDEGEAEEEEAPKAAPKVDPFAHLPKSTMVLDEWKRTFSNAPFKEDQTRDFIQSMPRFWEMLDKAGYSLWHQLYKHNAENKVNWMTSNLISGFLERSEEMRKHAFGVMLVLGEAAPFEVEGVWLMRGTEAEGVKAMLECNPDAEYFDWVRLDADSEAHRKIVSDIWCSPYDTKLAGTKFIYDSRTFK
jgi:elongation factor 1-gamma